MRRRVSLCLLLSLSLVVSACGDDDDGDGATGAEAGDGEELVGVFKIDPGECGDDGTVTKGSYFRMIQVGGTPEEGPYMPNGDSPCSDKEWTPMNPGGEGLRTGAFQPFPEPAFDEGGNATAALITQPTVWFGVAYANATNEEDPQTGDATSMPTIMAADGRLSGDLSAFAAAWNKQHFNQGAPKPGGERPGHTSGPTGTYDEATGRYTLDWMSQIVGDAFNNFTGVWHLEGAFEPDE